MPQDPLDVGQEAEVEHLVGLVEHQRADPAEVRGGAARRGRAAGRGCRPRRRRPCAARRSAARRRGRRRSRRPGRRGGRPASDRSLATWTQSSRVGTTTRACGTSRVRSAASPSAVLRGLGGRHEPLQQRHAERERLAHAGAGLADHVVAGQRERQREFLDGERAVDARLGQRRHDLGADPELGEGGGVFADGGTRLEGVRLHVVGASSGDSVEISVEFSVGTDRVIASLRAQGPVSARRPPVAVTPGPGRRADEALYAPGRLRLPG